MKQLVILINNPNLSFVATEILSFAATVDYLLVISTGSKEPQYTLPENVLYKQVNTSGYKDVPFSFNVVKVLVNDLWHHRSNKVYLKQVRRNFSYLRQANYLKLKLKKTLYQNGFHNAPILSFWADIWSLTLALLKQDSFDKKVYTRLHGRDLYEEREPTITYAIPFRQFVIGKMNRLYPVSDHGTNYLQNKYPFSKDKVITSYLGCNDLGFSDEVGETFTILSIAKIRNIKRIYRIAEVVKEFPSSIKWVHIGGEANRNNDKTIADTISLMDEINNIAGKEVINYGETQPEALPKIIHKHKPHILLNTSEYEGLPVSVMEAFSMGIPCLATNVGGTSELVSPQFLLNQNFNNDSLLKKLHEIKCSYSFSWKEQSRRIWEERLNPVLLRKQLFSSLK